MKKLQRCFVAGGSKILKTLTLRQSQYFVQLQTEPPARIAQAVLFGKAGVFLSRGPVHRLQQEVFKIECCETIRLSAFLRIDEFEFVT